MTGRRARAAGTIMAIMLAGCASTPPVAPSAAAPLDAPARESAGAPATFAQVERLSRAAVPSSLPTLPGGTVTVTVTDLISTAGSDMMVVLYEGALFDPDGYKNLKPFAGLGGFAARVGTDPATVTGTLRTGPPRWTARPPAFGDGIAAIPSGTHTVIVWVGDPLEPYGGWVPSDPIERWCFALLEVGWPVETELTVPAPTPRVSGDPGGPCDPSLARP